MTEQDSPPIPDETPQRPTLGQWFVYCVIPRYVALMFLLFVAYLLAIGPLYWEWYKEAHMDGEGTLLRLYMPLDYVCEVNPTIGGWVDSYIQLWIG